MGTFRKKTSDVASVEAGQMKCRRCGVCCTRHQASVLSEDVQRIASFLGITPEDWQTLYDDPRWEYDNYRLIRHVNGACAFLKYEEGLASCSIYPVRPACCSDWLPGEDKRECKQGKRLSNGKIDEIRER